MDFVHPQYGPKGGGELNGQIRSIRFGQVRGSQASEKTCGLKRLQGLFGEPTELTSCLLRVAPAKGTICLPQLHPMMSANWYMIP